MKKILALLLMSMLLLTAASAEQQSRTLVVYYSATGMTQAIAEQIAALTGADIFSLEPVTPYTDEDLNWRDRESRVVKEHEAGEKPVELVSVEVEGWDNYDTVYIGYPQLKSHLILGKEHGITREEAVEIVTQLAFYCGWPKAWSTFPMIAEVWPDEE